MMCDFITGDDMAGRDWKKYYAENKDGMNKARQKYAKNHEKFISVRLNRTNDADIIARLEAASNKMGYIKRLIREDIARSGFDPGPKPVKPGDPPPISTEPVEPVQTREQTPEELAELEAIKKAWGIKD